MNKHSSDYIPYACEIETARAEAAARVKDKPDPRNDYLAKYTINGKMMSERITALSIKEAEDHVKQQCGMVGWQPIGLQVYALDTIANKKED